MKPDEIGYWSELKLEFLKNYTSAYTKILQKQIDFHIGYIEGFSGSGEHLSKRTGEIIAGSPLLALDVEFDEYHLIEIDKEKAKYLAKCTEGRKNVTIYNEDSNLILPTIFSEI